MALTRDFKQTIKARVEADPAFRDALLMEAVNACLTGDTATGRALLRDLINATTGFEALARQLHKSDKSLHRMLSPGGNPTTDNFFALLGALQQNTGVRLETATKPRKKTSLTR